MKRKRILTILSIVLVLTLVFAFVACNNDDSSDDNDLPKIRLKEDMTIAEVKEALSDVKSFKYEFIENGESYDTNYITESGHLGFYSEDEVDEYFAIFIEDKKIYELYREVENSVETYNDYVWMNVTDEDINDAKQLCAEYLEGLLEEIEEDVEEGDATFIIKNNKISCTEIYDGETYEIVLSDFNKTSLPINKYFPNYKNLAVEYIDENDNGDDNNSGYNHVDEELQAIAKEDLKIGLICLHDEQSTYDANFINAMREAVENLGLKEYQLIIKIGIPETEQCYDAAVELVEQGCNVIFADSYGHEDYIIRAAKEYPAVRFSQASGVKAHTENLDNFHNAYASIYEGRYLAGVAAGMKLIETYDTDNDGVITDDEAKIGYVGAFPYAGDKSSYTAFFLGVRSVVANATMEVKFAYAWYDELTERDIAMQLISRGARLISQYADSMGAPNACEEMDIPNVTYNFSTENRCSDTYVIGSKINWTPYFKYIIECAIANEEVGTDWTGTLETGSVEILEIGAAAAIGTAEKLTEVKEKLISGEIKVFDTNNFTVDGGRLVAYMADVDFDEAYVPDTQVVENGEFKESYYRSAPYFDVDIDGITIIS